MNEFLNREYFNILGNREISRFIEQSEELVILAIPSLSKQIAKTLIDVSVSPMQIVISKNDPTKLRTSEHIEAIDFLVKKGITIRMSDAFALGVLIVDQKGWLFTPIAEDQKSVNSFAVSIIEAEKLVSSLAAIIVNKPVDPAMKPELGETVLEKEVLEDLREEQKSLHKKEQVQRVMDVNIEFVELEFKGIRIGSKKIPIPKELTELGMEDEVKEILSSSAKLFANEHDFGKELKKLEEHRNQIRKEFLVNIAFHGMVIGKHMKEDFNKAIEVMHKEIEKTKQSIRTSLDNELQETKKALFSYYKPIIEKNPPNQLRKYSNLFDEGKIEDFLEHLFRNKFPNVDKLVDDIELQCRFKGVTIELMNDEKFLRELEKQGLSL